MENTTTHGRKVIRPKKKNIAVKRFMAYTVAVLAIGGLVGGIVGSTIHKGKQTISDKNENIMQHVNQFGSYDGRILLDEVSMDWGTDDKMDFVPIDCKLDEETQEFVYLLCKGYDIDWTLVMALMMQESSFRSDVISDSDDYGLMQINKMNHEWLTETIGVTDFLDKEQNIRAGVFVLRKLFEEYTDVEMVLMCYNMGETSASRLWDKGIYSTTYAESILNYQKQFKENLKGKDGTF